MPVTQSKFVLLKWKVKEWKRFGMITQYVDMIVVSVFYHLEIPVHNDQ